MKLKCVKKNFKNTLLTVGKIYKTVERDGQSTAVYWVINDNGRKSGYIKRNFKELK